MRARLLIMPILLLGGALVPAANAGAWDFARAKAVCPWIAQSLAEVRAKIAAATEYVKRRAAYATSGTARGISVEIYAERLAAFRNDPAALPQYGLFEEEAAWMKAQLERRGIPALDVAELVSQEDWQGIRRLASVLTGDRIVEGGMSDAEIARWVRKTSIYADRRLLAEWEAATGQSLQADWRKLAFEKYRQEIVSGALESILRETGVYRSEKWTEAARRRIRAVLATNSFRTLFCAVVSWSLWREGIVQVPSYRFRVDAKTVEKALLTGLTPKEWEDALAKSRIRARLEIGGRVLARTIFFLAPIVVAQILPSEIEVAALRGRDGVQQVSRHLEEIRRKSPQERAFDLWKEAREEELGHPLDPNSEEYRAEWDAIVGPSRASPY